MNRTSIAAFAFTTLLGVGIVAEAVPPDQGTDKQLQVISTKETQELEKKKSDVVLLDVRTVEEYNSGTGHLKNAILIPVQELEQRVGELEKYKDKTIIAYCRTGRRSGTATEFLTKKGFKVLNMEGGIVKWNEEKLPVEKTTPKHK